METYAIHKSAMVAPRKCRMTMDLVRGKKATVAIDVGDDTILSDSYPMNKTDITKSWTTSGVKTLKVKVNGVTKYEQTVDFNKGDQTVTVK